MTTTPTNGAVSIRERAQAVLAAHASRSRWNNEAPDRAARDSAPVLAAFVLSVTAPEMRERIAAVVQQAQMGSLMSHEQIADEVMSLLTEESL